MKPKYILGCTSNLQLSVFRILDFFNLSTMDLYWIVLRFFEQRQATYTVNKMTPIKGLIISLFFSICGFLSVSE